MRFLYSNRNITRNKRLIFYCRKILTLTLIGILTSCHGSSPQKTSPESTVNITPEPIPSPQEAPAIISEIQSQPVWLRRLKAISEISAKQGMKMQIGETIRTEGKALAEINLKNGLAFRIGGNAVLTLQPDNRLNLSAGEMITWVTPGKKVPTQVITPGGIAGIRGTTIYVKMPKNPKDAIEFFTWEGTMFIQLPNKPEEFQLKAGEIVKIKPGETDINKVRASVRRLTNQEWSNRRHKSPLINNFDQPLPTLQKIDQTAPSVHKKSSLTPTPLASSQITNAPKNTSSPNLQMIPGTTTITPSPNQQKIPQTLTPTKKITPTPQNSPTQPTVQNKPNPQNSPAQPTVQNNSEKDELTLKSSPEKTPKNND